MSIYVDVDTHIHVSCVSVCVSIHQVSQVSKYYRFVKKNTSNFNMVMLKLWKMVSYPDFQVVIQDIPKFLEDLLIEPKSPSCLPTYWNERNKSLLSAENNQPPTTVANKTAVDFRAIDLRESFIGPSKWRDGRTCSTQGCFLVLWSPKIARLFGVPKIFKASACFLICSPLWKLRIKIYALKIDAWLPLKTKIYSLKIDAWFKWFISKYNYMVPFQKSIQLAAL